jgi:hypothetical protein
MCNGEVTGRQPSSGGAEYFLPPDIEGEGMTWVRQMHRRDSADCAMEDRLDEIVVCFRGFYDENLAIGLKGSMRRTEGTSTICREKGA